MMLLLSRPLENVHDLLTLSALLPFRFPLMMSPFSLLLLPPFVRVSSAAPRIILLLTALGSLPSVMILFPVVQFFASSVMIHPHPVLPFPGPFVQLPPDPLVL
jgi:hypothetical protein